jgi:alpha-tubulin suppressor-like RCC1 family protein
MRAQLLSRFFRRPIQVKLSKFHRRQQNMFSMIIVIMAIALVALLALATLYFGGSALQKDSKKLIAHTLVNQSGQIAAARQILRTEGFLLPEGQVVTLPPSALVAMPVPPRAAYADDAGEPSASDWEYYLPTSKEHFGLKAKLNADTCMELNRSQGFIGIPAAWDGVSRMQCFGPTDAGYTFLHELPNHSAEEHTQAIDKSVTDARPDAPTVRPGYPRLCPDGTTIETGLCEGTSAPPEQPSEPAKGFWVITATADGYNTALTNKGYSETCPAGAIDPTSSAVQPAPSLPEEPFNVDGAVELGWQDPLTWESGFTAPLTRTWCIPASPEDVPAEAELAPSSNSGGIENIVQTVSPQAEGVVPDAYTSSTNRTVVVTANGVTWSLIASEFTADTVNSDSGDYLTMEGRKVAIGRTPGATKSYFVNSPSLTANGLTYTNVSGAVTFAPPEPPCVPPVLNAPLGTGGDIISLKTAAFTSALLKRDGSVWVTGDGGGNAFGNCRYTGSTTWTRVATDVVSIDLNFSDLFMVKRDSSLWGTREAPWEWMYSDHGKHIKLIATGVKQAVSTTTGFAFVKQDGTLWYSGLNELGEAGNGTLGPVKPFAQIDTNVSSITTASANLLYIKNDKTLWATGEGEEGQLGPYGVRNKPYERVMSPGYLPVKLADDVIEGRITRFTTVYLKSDGSVYLGGGEPAFCGLFNSSYGRQFHRIAAEAGPVAHIWLEQDSIWLQGRDGVLRVGGCNDFASFGDGTKNPRTTFTPIASNVASFAGGMTSLVLDTSGELWAAGRNDAGQFGNGTTTTSTTFVPVRY